MKQAMAFLLSCVCIICLFVSCGPAQPTSVNDTIPETYAALVQLHMHSTVNLYLDEDDRILAIEFIGAEAKAAYQGSEATLPGKSIGKGVELLTDLAIDGGYLSDADAAITVDLLKIDREERKTAVVMAAATAIKNRLTLHKLSLSVNLRIDGIALEE